MEIMHGREVHHRSPAMKESQADGYERGRLESGRRDVGHRMKVWNKVILSEDINFLYSTRGNIHLFKERKHKYFRTNIYEIAYIPVG